jgi:hypothetical protein
MHDAAVGLSTALLLQCTFVADSHTRDHSPLSAAAEGTVSTIVSLASAPSPDLSRAL